MSAIETHALRKRYGEGEQAVVAIDGLDLRIEAGEVFGFLGPNGAGKSTTINVLLDFVRPTSGSATILGRDVHEEATAIRERIGILPEGFGLYDRLTGRRHLEFAVDWKDATDDPGAILAQVGLSEAAAARPVGTYSRGMRQRLALGMAIVGDPAVLILDEPSTGLDPLGIREMRALVRSQARNGTTVFFSSHILGEVEAVCDRVGILHDGELVAVDDVEELRATVGAGAELRLRVDGPPAVDVSGIDGVEAVSRSGEVLSVTVDEPHRKAEVVSRLTDAGTRIHDLDARQPSLEDVFTAYTTAEGRSDDRGNRRLEGPP